jgi:hypothetical protein
MIKSTAQSGRPEDGGGDFIFATQTSAQFTNAREPDAHISA